MEINSRIFVRAGAIAGAVFFAGSAQAQLLSLSCERFTGEGWFENGYAGLTTYRVYAEFDECCDDGVLSVFGISGAPLRMSSSNGEFHNAMYDSLTAPMDLTSVGIWENQWDTYVTINATDASGDATTTGPSSFGTDTNNLATDWLTENGGWFVTPDDEQSRHIDGRVLLGQFTVDAGVTISGTLNLLLVTSGGGGGPFELPLCSPHCPEDIDGSGLVDLGDVLAVLSSWGNKGGPEDLDRDGFVGFGDVLVVLRAWGACE